MPDEKKTPLDSAVELFVYAPLGLALTARDSLPDLIAKGRQQLTSQVMLARMMGQFAVAEGEKEARKRIGEVTETLTALGVLPGGQPAPSSPAPMPTPPPEAVVEQPAAAPPATNGKANGKAKGPAASDLAIPGYDTLSASQVVQRLAGLAADELAAVHDYEAANRGRRTILSKVAQLQAGPTA
jgi:hypothetical protein